MKKCPNCGSKEIKPFSNNSGSFKFDECIICMCQFRIKESGAVQIIEQGLTVLI